MKDMMSEPTLKNEIDSQVKRALLEDLGLSSDNEYVDISQDITARLIPDNKVMRAQIITRENCVLCGVDWVNSAFLQCDPLVKLTWMGKDSDHVKANQVLLEIEGNARAILTAERTALNFLQTLSGTATITFDYITRLQKSKIRLLDTRKTIPQLRLAQKYAVRCGGGNNHRIGLFDAFLIKENHIHACGGISNAIDLAKKTQPNKTIEIEVETIKELKEAISSKADIIMLDNFNSEQIARAVEINQGQCKLEVSGNITKQRLDELAESGVDYISTGALTKHVHAIDMSLLKRDN